MARVGVEVAKGAAPVIEEPLVEVDGAPGGQEST
jgi:hypothetical protein